MQAHSGAGFERESPPAPVPIPGFPGQAGADPVGAERGFPSPGFSASRTAVCLLRFFSASRGFPLPPAAP